jgi:hypothetical protein
MSFIKHITDKAGKKVASTFKGLKSALKGKRTSGSSFYMTTRSGLVYDVAVETKIHQCKGYSSAGTKGRSAKSASRIMYKISHGKGKPVAAE